MNPVTKILRLNWFLFALMAALIVSGIFFIKSATAAGDTAAALALTQQQQRWALVGLAVFLCCALIDYELVLRFAPLLFLLSVVSLVVVLVGGQTINGATSWLRLGGLVVQPAEPGKIAFILGMSWLLLVMDDYKKKFWFFILIGLVALIPAGLILKQPDLGTALVFFPVTCVIMWAAGMPKRFLALLPVGVGVGLVFAYFIVYQAWWDGTAGDLWPAGQRAGYVVAGKKAALPSDQLLKLAPATGKKKGILPLISGGETAKKNSGVILKPYQLGRIRTFFEPDLDPLGDGWTIRQSMNTIGSGGFKGKGYVSEYGFLPKNIAYNDFIFAVIGEEVGFVGGTLFILCQSALIIGVLYVAGRARDAGGMLLCLGFAALLFAHFFQNVAMTVKVAPITGIPLPFTSYGGSFLVTCMAGMGLVQSVWIHRKNFYNH
ncbi:MAG: rod shape-determining protein RodA [Verrucomicrobiales bacterium]|jgi:rod shape determining protein RodA|nr:rod shape-determining protein RodA [Verrucomicrobiales bacterium]